MAFLSQAPRLEGLLPSHGAFQGHAAHLMRWPMRLSPNGSRDTCISQGLSTFLHAAFTAHRSHATTSADCLCGRQTTTFHPSPPPLPPRARWPLPYHLGYGCAGTRCSPTPGPLLSSSVHV